MICVAISDKNPLKAIAILDKVEMAEIRLDLTEYDLQSIDQVFAHKTKTIATCRPDKIGPDKQKEILSRAIDAGANYVDIEVEADKKLRKYLVDYARNNHCRVIISYHNFNNTPGLRELFQTVDLCFNMGADVAKLATYSESMSDNARLLSLYSVPKPVIALGMGQIGKITRIMATMMGAEFTFAAMDEGEATAPGQIIYSEMKELINQISGTLMIN